MDFLIADTFTDSLAKLNNDEQKAVKTTAFDLQVNPAHPSLSLHRIDTAKDKNFQRLSDHLEPGLESGTVQSDLAGVRGCRRDAVGQRQRR